MFRFKSRGHLLALILLLSFNGVGNAQDKIRIGLLVPLSGPLKTLGMQVRAGAELGVQDSPYRDEFELVVPKYRSVTSWENPKDVGQAYREFRKEDVDFVMGGVTKEASDALRAVATKSNIRVILLAPASKSLPSHVFQMGVTQEEIYRETVRQWASELEIRTVLVIYDRGHKESYKLGADVTSDVFEDGRVHLISFVASKGSGRLDHRRVEKALKRHRPDGIIVAGLPWEGANIVRELGAKTETPIYIATPLTWSHQVWKYVSADKAQVYYGAQYWPSTEQESRRFADRLRDSIGWSKAEISAHAIRAYDAVHIIGEWSKTGESVKRFDGFAGVLELVNDHILKSPIRLLHVNKPDYPSSCPDC